MTTTQPLPDLTDPDLLRNGLPHDEFRATPCGRFSRERAGT